MMKKFLSITMAALIIALCFGIVGYAAGDSISSATSISMGSTKSGTISNSNTKDFYTFTISNSSKVTVKYNGDTRWINLYIYDSEGDQIWGSGTLYCDTNTEEISYNKDVHLTSGKYYFAVVKNNYNGDYSIRLSSTSASESFKETNGGSNNSLGTADSISLNTTYKGQIAENDIKDFYKFSTSSGTLKVTLNGDIQWINLYVYNSSGNQVWSSGTLYANSSTSKISYTKDVSLSSGTYYFAAVKNNYCGNYSFKLGGTSSGSTTSSIKLSLSDDSVSVKPDGTVKVTCSYTGTNPNTITISYSRDDSSVVSCSWGSWSNRKIPITITGLKEGSTRVKISLKDTVTKEVLDYDYINVTVESNPSNNGGSGNSGSGGISLFEWIVNILALLIEIFL